VVSASIDPNGLATSVRVQYGATTAYGMQTAATIVPSSAAATQVSVPVGGLQPGTDYHVRILATNSDGATMSSDLLVHTLSASVLVPALTGDRTVATTDATASVGATLDDGGATTTYHLEYGTTPAMGQQTPDQVLPAGSGPTDVSAALAGLDPETTYYA